MAAEQWDRLRYEQEKAIHETDARIKQLDKYRADYVALKERLSTLPEEVTHDIMVPFGDLAFMPGKIYHSNEILVLLGDNWFTETSAHHAAEIVSRRIQGVEDQIGELKGQLGLLQPRKEFTNELQQMTMNPEGFMEINEYCDEEKEKERRAKREPKSVAETLKSADDKQQRAASQALAQQVLARNRSSGGTQPSDPPQVPPVDEAHVEKMARLDELEMQERRKQELGASMEEDTSSHPIPTNYPPKNTGKTVRWRDSQGEEDEWCTDDDDDDDDDDEYEEEEDDDEADDEDQECETRLPQVLKVTFTKTDIDSDKDENYNSKDIISPRDVYRQFVAPHLSKPKSILKRTSSYEEPVRNVKVEPVEEVAQGDHQQAEAPEATPKPQPKVTAFGDTVKEKITSNQMVASLCASLDDVEVSGGKKSAPKKMSKFKQRQMQAKK